MEVSDLFYLDPDSSPWESRLDDALDEAKVMVDTAIGALKFIQRDYSDALATYSEAMEIDGDEENHLYTATNWMYFSLIFTSLFDPHPRANLPDDAGSVDPASGTPRMYGKRFSDSFETVLSAFIDGRLPMRGIPFADFLPARRRI